MTLNFDPVPDLASTLLHLNLRRTVVQPWTRIEAAQFDAILSGEPFNAIQERNSMLFSKSLSITIS